MSNDPLKLTISLASGRIICKQCQATSKRSRVQCQAPAMRGNSVCRIHGGLSTGPRTKEGRKRCALANTVHGNDTRAARAQRKERSKTLHSLVNLGNAVGLFSPKAGLPGRPPKK
jgi:hypothetical protein